MPGYKRDNKSVSPSLKSNRVSIPYRKIVYHPTSRFLSKAHTSPPRPVPYQRVRSTGGKTYSQDTARSFYRSYTHTTETMQVRRVKRSAGARNKKR